MTLPSSRIKNPDAIVVGSGPNGLAAAITIARAGRSVVVYEAENTIGGGERSAELTLPGFVHDICSSVHPMGAASTFFRSIPLQEFGAEWLDPEACVAHPFDDGTAISVTRSLDETAAQFGPDQQAVRDLLVPFVGCWDELSSEILRPARLPHHPWLLARFGRLALMPALRLALRKFKTGKARTVFAGMAAHSKMPLTAWGSASFGIVLWATCHSVGWPFVRGGSQALTNALAAYLRKLGGEVVCGARVHALDELPKSPVVLCDVTPRQFLEMAGNRVSSAECRRLGRYHYGPGVFKIDWSLDGRIPWNAPACARAGTVHLGGSLEEIVKSERAASGESPAELPFVLITQPSLFDATRAPSGKHVAWGYCHVPLGCRIDVAERIETQVERFAAGFRRRIIGRSVMNPAGLQQHNANLIGGDISGGSMSLSRLLIGSARRAYITSVKGVFLCSSSTPPGPGVHGLCGYFAARLANERCF